VRDAFIFDAVRTPRGRGKSTGALYEVKPIELVATVLRALESRNDLNTAEVGDVILGCVTAVGDQGSNIAKTASLYAGWSDSVSGVTLNRFCASGLEACNQAFMKIQCGVEELLVAGGVESMSRVTMGSDGGDWFQNPLVNEATGYIPQGVSADLIATLEGFPREVLDQFAVRSHQLAAKAWKESAFEKTIVPVLDQNGVEILSHDELVRADANLETLSALRPSFIKMGAMGFDATALRVYPQARGINHVHHPGNSSGIVDGAAGVLIGSEDIGQKYGWKPRAKVRAMSWVCTEPTIMLEGPAPAAKKALKFAGLTPGDLDLVEVNEAFAAVVLKFQRAMGINPEKINVNGGAIAMGHPLGATGAMILSTLLDELERRDQTLGLCTLCVGGGMGVATIIERV
jgi:acetyl-CoA C-acetyltransferase